MSDDGTPVVQFPGTTPRDPRATPWLGDKFTDGRYVRTFLQRIHRPPGARFDQQVDARHPATHVLYRTPRGRGRMALDRWASWVSDTEVLHTASPSRWSGLDWGAIRQEDEGDIRRVVFEWGNIEMDRATQTAHGNCETTITIYGLLLEAWLPRWTNLRLVGWALHQGMFNALRLDAAQQALLRAAAERGKIVRFPR